MIPKKVEALIVKYLSHAADSSDLKVLNEWIENPGNEGKLKSYVKTLFAIEMGMNDSDPGKIKKNLLRQIRRDKSIFQRYRIKSVLKYAAIASVFLAIGYALQQNFLSPNKPSVIVPKQESITLQLENGETKILSENGDTEVVDSQGNVIGQQQGRSLKYTQKTPKETLGYNVLKVPFGKRFDITLSDGSVVFLNAGSSIRYPVQFLNGMDRKVYLEGEAFFDVTKDAEHPFTVKIQNIEVEVLGTQFNLADYPEDKDAEVVLVAGSVRMVSSEKSAADGKGTVLDPGFKGSYDKTTRAISLEKVNTKIYTSWRDGHVVFRNTSFENIIRKLERLYNVTIINNNEQLAQATFNATIETDEETIEKVFDYFSKVYDIDYSIVENKIIVN